MSAWKITCSHNHYHISPRSKNHEDLLRANFHSSGRNAWSLSAMECSPPQSYSFNSRYCPILINLLSRCVLGMCHYEEEKKKKRIINSQVFFCNDTASGGRSTQVGPWKITLLCHRYRAPSSQNYARESVCYVAVISRETKEGIKKSSVFGWDYRKN